MAVNVKRAYEPAVESDGLRVLVDRLWPRGLSKEQAKIDLWLKEVAPSARLRKWFAHDPAKWSEFRERYFQELDCNRAPVEQLEREARHGTVTLIYGARDREHNDAVALQGYLERDPRPAQ